MSRKRRPLRNAGRRSERTGNPAHIQPQSQKHTPFFVHLISVNYLTLSLALLQYVMPLYCTAKFLCRALFSVQDQITKVTLTWFECLKCHSTHPALPSTHTHTRAHRKKNILRKGTS